MKSHSLFSLPLSFLRLSQFCVCVWRGAGEGGGGGRGKRGIINSYKAELQRNYHLNVFPLKKIQGSRKSEAPRHAGSKGKSDVCRVCVSRLMPRCASEGRLWVWEARVQILVPWLTHWVTLRKWLNLSVPQFPHLQNWVNTYPIKGW